MLSDICSLLISKGSWEWNIFDWSILHFRFKPITRQESLPNFSELQNQNDLMKSPITNEQLLQPPQLNDLPEVIVEEVEDEEHENDIAVDSNHNNKQIEDLEKYADELRLQLDIVIKEKDIEVLHWLYPISQLRYNFADSEVICRNCKSWTRNSEHYEQSWLWSMIDTRDSWVAFTTNSFGRQYSYHLLPMTRKAWYHNIYRI